MDFSGLHVLVSDAVIADERVGETDKLAAVGRIREDFLVSGHARAVAVACGKHTLVYKKRGTKKIEGYGEAKDIAKARRDGAFFAALLLAFSLIYTVACIFLLGGKYSISDIFIGALSFASSGAAAVYLNVLYFCRLRTIITLQKNGVILRNPSSAELAADSDVFVVRDIGDIKTGKTELEAVFVSGRDRGEDAKFKNDSDARELFKILSLNSSENCSSPETYRIGQKLRLRHFAKLPLSVRAISFPVSVFSDSGQRMKTIRAQHRCMLKTENIIPPARGTSTRSFRSAKKFLYTARRASSIHIQRDISANVPMCTVKGEEALLHFQSAFRLTIICRAFPCFRHR